jgi:hypothetical protein
MLGDARKLDYRDFQSILEHKDVYLESFGRLRALWRDGTTAPRDTIKGKTYRGLVRAKRAPEGTNGATRPWTVKELRSL